MDINFRFESNQGIKYLDLFPQTQMSALKQADNSLSYDIININIPSFTSFSQTFTIDYTLSTSNAIIYMFPTSNDSSYITNYNNLTSFEINQNQITIFCLYDLPNSSISVNLIILKGGV